jgi:predicted RNA-binding protein with PUA-like domain
MRAPPDGLPSHRGRVVLLGSFERHTVFRSTRAGQSAPRRAAFPRDLVRPRRQNAGMNYWLVKSEPATYSWAHFVKDGETAWTGVRNYQARIHLRAMAVGDTVLFYHSGETREIVGIAKVTRAASPDPTAKEGDWVCVELSAVKALAKSVDLGLIKSDKVLREMVLAKNSRLSVSPVTESQFNRVLTLADTKI